jgi:hypothetical protein
MSTLAVAERIASQTLPRKDPKDEFARGVLKIRGNTLVIGNSIYAIDNISTITLTDLRKPVPPIVWIILIGGGVLLLSGGWYALLGFLLVALAAHLLYLNWTSRAGADYALSIRMNGGNVAAVMANNGEFLKAIALELYGVIETAKASYTTFNIDRSIKLDNITGSVIPIGTVSGDIVNAVEGF